MPNNNGRIQTVYLPTGNPDTTNVATLYRPGELGAKFDSSSGGTVGTALYQRVQCDSGATSATPTGAVAINQAAFWKNKANYIVTNDSRFAEGGQTTSGWRNQVAGVFRVAATAGNYVDIITRGANVPLSVTTATPGVGDIVIANSGTAADFSSIAAGSNLTYVPLGKYTTTVTASVASADIDLPEVD